MIKITKVSETSVMVSHIEGDLEDTGTVVSLKNPIAGTDYYIYDRPKKGLKISKKEKCSSKNLIGGFHYGLIPHDFEARNNISVEDAEAIRGINAYSIWTQEHRPTCKPQGMTYNPIEDIWVDIYMLGSEWELFGTSAPHQHFLAGSNSNGRVNPKGSVDFLYKDFEEVAKANGKRLITFDEFISSMKGVKEFDSARDTDNGITKHHPDFVSRYGIEQATGHNWIWSEKIDNEKAVLLGGSRGDGARAGSRASDWINFVWYSNWGLGCRFACDSLSPVSQSRK